ncbi:flagellar basal body rod protein FlgB [Alteribacter keqinensis]|uniref:Flagellar basal body rod protein FlgB n=2 Tax=Alteribacter TaxID=2823237 RepID=A0A3M7TVC6_9BACI|nr:MULTISPECIES: flagellar basal body rod protein FlgB [Alteribacter]MBM7094167.1 flagellar basal body rod protein FlgB [Alteribacter salitolerans]RNA69600.1 flagellar basal body rod protein FlgB [Alteribacter keqinensis]
MNLFNNSTNQLLHSALNASMTRQNTISNNIANVDTPSYKAKKTVFSHELKSAMNKPDFDAHRTDSRHLSFREAGSSGVEIQKRTNTAYNHNGNNVDIDLEMTEMAKNQIYYNTLIDRMNGRFNSIQTVIGQGR